MADPTRTQQAIVIGGSAGALEALGALLPALPRDYPLPIAVVLHVPPGRPSQLVNVLGLYSALPVREADDKQPFCAGVVHVAPPNYHLLLEKNGCFALSVDDPVLFSRPSIDVLFESAADALGPLALGVLLSGANEDGAHGLLRIQRAGGQVVVQDPDSAPARAMPDAALRLTQPDYVLPAARLGALLASLTFARPSLVEPR
ncbi:MAG: chemotaxis protein CheB [Polyangiaceae bacterium]